MGRRSGLLRALTIDIEDLYTACDPDSENLCLYGNPDETWEIDLPADQVPAELPEPTIGINFARSGLVLPDLYGQAVCMSFIARSCTPHWCILGGKPFLGTGTCSSAMLCVQSSQLILIMHMSASSQGLD